MKPITGTGVEFPTVRIKNLADLGKGVDLLLEHIKTEKNPRKQRDLVFVLATLSRLTNLGLGLAATGVEGEKAQASVADVYVKLMATDVAKALGYEMKDKI